MSHAGATPAACQPAHQHAVPIPGVDGPDIAAIQRVASAGAGPIVVRPGPGALSGPSASISWIGRPKHSAPNKLLPLQH